MKVESLNQNAEKRDYISQEVLGHLDCAGSVFLNDTQAILRIAWTMPRAAQDRAVLLMQSPTLHSWITSTGSSALFVNGNHGTSARQSPLSFVCAKLMDSICPATNDIQGESKGIMAQVFFCGQHLSSKDPDSGIAAVVRNLLAQLLISNSEFDVATVRQLLEIDPDEVVDLCAVFSELVMQIPQKKMVFCIIDAMTFHEDSSTRCKEAMKLVQMLLDLVETCNKGHCIFKVLLTAPGTSRVLHKSFAKTEVIWVRLLAFPTLPSSGCTDHASIHARFTPISGFPATLRSTLSLQEYADCVSLNRCQRRSILKVVSPP